jgi:glycosyltransferase involved in cell wall biosynthesis
MVGPATVVHMVEGLQTGGLEKVVHSLAVAHDRSRFAPEVWCLARGGELAEAIATRGVPVRILGMQARPSPGFLLGLARELRRSRAGIVHCHGYTACTVGRVAAVLARIPLIFAHVHTQGLWLAPRQRRIERLLSRFSAKVICVSESVRQFVVREERIPGGRTAVVYNGIPDPRLPAGGEARRTLGIPDAATVVACIASLEPHKGHADLIEAARIARRGLDGLVLLLVGDGSLRGALERQAREAGVPTQFPGRLDDVGPALAAMDVMVLLSRQREGSSLALVEAMAASKPVVATRVGGMPEVVAEGVTGVLCEPQQPQQAAAAIRRILESPDLMRAMGAAGRRAFLARFTVDRMVSAIETLYDR